jgi:hypothetical protein
LPNDFNELYAAVSSKMFEKWEEKVQKKEAEKRSTITPETLDNTSLDTVTPLTNISYINVAGGVTETEGNLETPTTPQTTQWTGWVLQMGKWVQARVIGCCSEGTRYVVEYLQSTGDIGEMLVFPEKFREVQPCQ